MHSRKPEPASRSIRLLSRHLNGILSSFAATYIGARRLKNSAKYRYQARTAPTATSIAAMASALSKVPKHLSAIMDAGISADETDSDKLIQEAAEFAAWSAAAGIPTISIYDEQGELSLRRRDDEFTVLTTIVGILKHHAALFHVFASLRIKTLVPNRTHRVSVYLEGKLSLDEEDYDGRPPSLIIYLISEDDGRRAMGDVTETFAGKVKCGNIAVEEISVGLVAEQLHSLVMSAPDLIVVFRPELKLSGYPPWHLQQAEMELLCDNGKFSYVAFAHALRNYADAEMRHGK